MSKKPKQDPGRASFSIKEVAERNGVSVGTVYNAIKAKRLQVINLGTGARGAVRVTPEQEQAWLHACVDVPAEVSPNV